MLYRPLPLSILVVSLLAGAVAAQPVKLNTSVKPTRAAWSATQDQGKTEVEEADEADEDDNDNDEEIVVQDGGNVKIHGMEFKIDTDGKGGVPHVITIPRGKHGVATGTFVLDGADADAIAFEIGHGQDGNVSVRKVRSSKGENGHDGAFLGVSAAKEGDDVKLVNIVAKSAAEKAGLKAGDLLRSIDRHDVNEPEDLTNIIRSHQAGDTVPIVVNRDGKRVKVNATLGTAPGKSESDEAAPMAVKTKKAPKGAMAFKLDGTKIHATPEGEMNGEPMVRFTPAAPSAPKRPMGPSSGMGGAMGGMIARGGAGAGEAAREQVQQLREELSALRAEIRELKDMVRSLSRERK